MLKGIYVIFENLLRVCLWRDQINHFNTMGQKKKKRKSASELNFENELRKAKLQLEKGAHIHSSGNIPPELESIFLDHIEKFDKAYRNSKTISVFEKIGSPKFRSVDKITGKGIKRELNLLIKKMARKGIIIESVCQVEEREMYRFITEELFRHKMNNIPIKGMITHFTYEEFHPNHEYDVKSGTEDFIREILSDKEKLESYHLGQKFKTASGKIISGSKVIEKINFIRGFYSKFNIDKLEFSGININSKKNIAQAFFDLEYTATIEDSKEKQNFGGQGKALLKKKWDSWTIYQFEMPGIKI